MYMYIKTKTINNICMYVSLSLSIYIYIYIHTYMYVDVYKTCTCNCQASSKASPKLHRQPVQHTFKHKSYPFLPIPTHSFMFLYFLQFLPIPSIFLQLFQHKSYPFPGASDNSGSKGERQHIRQLTYF